MTEREALKLLIPNAQNLLDRFTFDVSGIGGRGGNGGLITKDTMKAADQLRMALEEIGGINETK